MCGCSLKDLVMVLQACSADFCLNIGWEMTEISYVVI